MENEDIYFEKYQKYKAKYLELKEVEQSGGFIKAFNKLKAAVGESPLDSYNNSLKAAKNKMDKNIKNILDKDIPAKFEEWLKGQQGKTFTKINDNYLKATIISDVSQNVNYQNMKDIFTEALIRDEYNKYHEAHELYLKLKYTEFPDAEGPANIVDASIKDTLEKSSNSNKIAKSIRLERENVGDISKYVISTSQVAALRSDVTAGSPDDNLAKLNKLINDGKLSVPLGDKFGFGANSIFAEVIQQKILDIYNNTYGSYDSTTSTLLRKFLTPLKTKLNDKSFSQNKLSLGLLLNVALILSLRRIIFQKVWSQDGENLVLFDTDGLVHGIKVNEENLQKYTEKNQNRMDVHDNLTCMGEFHTITIDRSKGYSENVNLFENFTNYIESISNINFNSSKILDLGPPLNKVVENYSKCLQLICDLSSC